MRIAVIYICTGSYHIFWEKMYQSSEHYFFPDEEKTYFVFTENKQIIENAPNNVNTYYLQKMGWPFDTLMRWDCICRVQDLLSEYDYICFCNANMLFLERIDFKDLSQSHHYNLISFFTKNKDRKEFEFEKNPRSKAWIPQEQLVKDYIRGGFIFANSKEFLSMSTVLREWTALDLRKGIIPIWHDESLLNAYVSDKEYHLIEDEVFMPEERATAKTKVIFQDKKRYGGNNNLRDIKESPFIKTKKKIHTFFCKANRKIDIVKMRVKRR